MRNPVARRASSENQTARKRLPTIEVADVAGRVDGVGFWWHSIDLGHGIVTPGQKTLDELQARWDSFRPKLRGKTVLDIGAWDGFFAFAAERDGAASVVALDHYVWSLDLKGQQDYWRRCREQGVAPAAYHETEYWRPGELPGKRGFDVARDALQSNVEAVVDDYATGDPARFGTFDIVLYLGVLYHMEDPVGALRRVAAMARELAVIETEAIFLPDDDDTPLFEFFPAAELNGDVSNWWAPNLAGLHAICKAAGFARVQTVVGPPSADRAAKGERYRAAVHAYK